MQKEPTTHNIHIGDYVKVKDFGPITIVLSDHKVTIEENGEITKIREYHKNHAK